MATTIIRTPVAEDLPAIAAIESVSDAEPWSPDALASHLAQVHALDAVAESGSTIIGFVCCGFAGDDLEVYKLAVDASWRRKGVAASLLRHIIGIASKKGIRRVYLEVARSNAAALRLYEGLGFEESYRRRNYYGAHGDDALVMSLAVASSG
ncbi:MAG: ribosomal-protein-alanine N-acetyltransferase [Chitinivibrionales bacterium]|nr:ribosomal-protein-alanine N-acetyltransferase [Chitinivibrionales bacterium]MBD3396894.1 ribosomal-protein-alanine N-acetyltransferase [Chitinivibrionales bacterium]